MFTRCLTRGFYPESLQVVFVVNAPMVFVAFLGVFTSWRSSGQWKHHQQRDLSSQASRTPWKINGWNIHPSPMKRKENDLNHPPPWGHVPAVNLQGCNETFENTIYCFSIVCNGVTAIIFESDCIQLSFFLILIEKWIFFWYMPPLKNPSIILLAPKHCRLFRLIKTWLDPVTAAKIQVIGALAISLMEEIWRSPVWSVEVGRKKHIIYYGFYTSQVVGLGISEPSTVFFWDVWTEKKKTWSPKLWAFWKPIDLTWGRQIRCWKISLGGFNRFNPQTSRPRIVFLLSGSHDFMDFLGKTDVFGGLKKV